MQQIRRSNEHTTLVLSHLPRSDKKSLLKGWNAALEADQQQQQAKGEDEPDHDTNHALTPARPRGASEKASGSALRAQLDERLAQWQQQTTATPLESQDEARGQASKAMRDDNDDEDGGDDVVMLTAGQVQRVYRARARQVEEIDKRKGRAELLKQRARVEGIRRIGKPKTKPKNDAAMANEHVGSNNEAAAEPEDVVDDPNVLKLSNLPAARLCISSTDRAEVLGVIRHALVAGQDVLLWSDCEQTHESVSETKLMQQQLCTQSLALCHREQELVPEQNSSVVQLHLIPRLRDH